MALSRKITIQLIIFAVIALTAAGFMAFGYVKVPAMLGIGRYTVTVQLPRAAGLYPTGNVTYRGTQVGKVESVHLTANGTVAAVLSLKNGIDIPSNLQAQVHSQSAIGEQYVALLPRDDASPPLKNGSVIALKDTSVPPDINSILGDANTGLQAIPHDSLKTTIDESYTAFAGLGPELQRLVDGSTKIASGAMGNLDSLNALIDNAGPVLDAQTDTADSVRAWASHLATITNQLRNNDTAVAGIIDNGGPAADQGRQLFERLQPSLPVLLSNLVSIGKVALVYRADLEQILVLLPMSVSTSQALAVPNRNVPGLLQGSLYQDFAFNLNLPPPCSTGFLPAQQRRTPVQVDFPERPAGDLYCRIPQDSPFNVRGARNIPCETVPGKRAPTVKMCESDEQYVPLNDGYNWKGDPNATLSGQDIPQLPPGSPPAAAPPPAPAAPSAPPPPLAIAQYDPGTGNYVGPDGKLYSQSDLAESAPKEKTWQQMLTPPS